MRMSTRHPATLLLAFGLGLSLFGRELRSAAEINAVIYSDATNNVSFRFEAVALEDVPTVLRASYCVMDDTGAVRLYFPAAATNIGIRAGDRLELTGSTSPGQSQGGAAQATDVRLIARGPAPEPLRITGGDFFSGKYANRLVRLTGFVRSVFPDEIDPNVAIVELHADGETVLVPIYGGSLVWNRARQMVGARVSVTGFVSPRGVSSRTHAGVMLDVGTDLGCFNVLEPPPADPFASPDVRTLDRLRPADIAQLEWHSAKGRVLCVWNGTHILIRTDDGKTLRADLDGFSMPALGTRIAVCGFPELNLFYLNLNQARWKPIDDTAIPPEEPVAVRTTDLLTDNAGRRMIRPGFHGKAIRLRGIVSPLSPDAENGPSFLLACGRQMVEVVFGDCAGAFAMPPAGATIDVSGICLVKSEPWMPSRHFPRLTGVAVVVREPSDLTVVERPPWWTTRRLLVALAVLAALTVLVLVWNASLRLLVARRGRQLFREEIAHCEARFRIDERTRLAVELHDSLAQNLTGVSLKIDAARRAPAAPARLREELDIASKALLSCRAELRNCLWDLRHQTLEVDDMGEALRQTLQPHVAHVDLAVRFNVPRARISDNTAHAILRIVRELTVNAVRHGQATAVRVAGSIEDDRLLFSVRDNGCGFDPENCPNDEQGHYGLLGIRERVNAFEGTMSVASQIGKGTKVTVALRIPQQA